LRKLSLTWRKRSFFDFSLDKNQEGKDNENMATTNQFIILSNNGVDESLLVNTDAEVEEAAAAVARAGLAWVPVWSGDPDGEGDTVKTGLKLFAEGDGDVNFAASDCGEPARRLTANWALCKNSVELASHATAATAAARANALPGWARWALINLIWGEADVDVEKALVEVEETLEK
jgi:hypothetical protein